MRVHRGRDCLVHEFDLARLLDRAHRRKKIRAVLLVEPGNARLELVVELDLLGRGAAQRSSLVDDLERLGVPRQGDDAALERGRPQDALEARDLAQRIRDVAALPGPALFVLVAWLEKQPLLVDAL